MCKFSSANAPGFNAISTDIRLWVQEAPVLIQRRWATEDHDHSARLQNQFKENMCPFANSSPPPAYTSRPATAEETLAAKKDKKPMKHSRSLPASPINSNPPPPYTVRPITTEPYTTAVNTTAVNITQVNTAQVNTAQVNAMAVNSTAISTVAVNATEVNPVMVDPAKRMALAMAMVAPQPLQSVLPPGQNYMADNMRTKAQLQGIQVPVVFTYPSLAFF